MESSKNINITYRPGENPGGRGAPGSGLTWSGAWVNDSGVRELSLQYTVSAPDLAFYFYTLEDAPRGNGNGVIDPGEASEIFVTIANGGGRANADDQAVGHGKACRSIDAAL